MTVRGCAACEQVLDHRAGWGTDVEHLADQSGIAEFSVAGRSGRGPHGMAIAVHLSDRVSHRVLASPVGAFDYPFMRKQLMMNDVTVMAKMHRLEHQLRWAFTGESRTVLKDVVSYADDVISPRMPARVEVELPNGAGHVWLARHRRR